MSGGATSWSGFGDADFVSSFAGSVSAMFVLYLQLCSALVCVSCEKIKSCVIARINFPTVTQDMDL